MSIGVTTAVSGYDKVGSPVNDDVSVVDSSKVVEVEGEGSRWTLSVFVHDDSTKL